MSNFLCSLDGGLDWEESANVLAEILDNTEAKHSRSRLSIRRVIGMKRSGNRWVEDIDRVWAYEWDNEEHEWVIL